MERTALSGPEARDAVVHLAPCRERSADVAVIGGGVIGLSTAWRIAQHGFSVVVIDPAPGSGASFVAGGMLGAVAETGFAERDAASAHRSARDAWEPFLADLATTGASQCEFTAHSTVLVGHDRSDRDAVLRLVGFQRSLGLAVEELSRDELDQTSPGLGRTIRQGFLLRDDAAIDNRAILTALGHACGQLPVTAIPEAATDVIAAGTEFKVRTATHELSCRAVIVATGAASLPRLPFEAVPPLIYPVAGTIIRLGRAETAPSFGATLRASVQSRPCYLVPRLDGSLVLGATATERGHDLRAPLSDVHQLLDDARTIFPGLDDFSVLEVATGLRPTTPDHRPVVGESALQGCYFALGHYRNGFLLAPLTASTLAASVVEHLERTK